MLYEACVPTPDHDQAWFPFSGKKNIIGRYLPVVTVA
jgi:hypothetical protein